MRASLWLGLASVCFSFGCQFYDCGFDHGHDRDVDEDFDERCDEAPGLVCVPPWSETPIADAGRVVIDVGATDEPRLVGCTSDAECGSELVCVEGACVVPSATCQFDLDCGPDRGCVDRACRPRCDEARPCGDGFGCTSGYCVPATQCENDAGCASGLSCIDARCLESCVDTCNGDEVCVSGWCRPDVAPRPFCTSNADCADGHLCVNGVCRTPCATGEDVECLRADSQLTRCAPVEPELLLCFTSHESNPECASSADCDGELCIDAVCR